MIKYVIRDAVKDDCVEIVRLIQELADFEKMPNGPEIDANVLVRDGFEIDNPLFKCLVVQDEQQLVGYALYFNIYSTWTGAATYMEDIYITPQCRKQGLGKSLFAAVAKKAVESKCRRLDFSVLDWNPAKEFYKSFGATDMTSSEGWMHYRIKDESLKKLSQLASTSTKNSSEENKEANPSAEAETKTN